MQQRKLDLTLGPILFFWSKETILDFYQQMALQPLEMIYLGETVCSRRQELRVADWIDLAHDLATSGKKIILSSQVLMESESDLKRLRKLTEQDDFIIEANDLGAVKLLHAKGLLFIAGQSLNIYNEDTLALMHSLGAVRWVASVELAADKLGHIMSSLPDVPCEILGWGKLPLAYSSRCFTARHYNLKKDSCEFKCLQHGDGLALSTREQQSFLTINGIQTMSAGCCSLISYYSQMVNLGVTAFRLSPQQQNMTEIIQIHRQVIDGELDIVSAVQALRPLAGVNLVDGYWQGKAGIKYDEEVSCAGS